MPCGTQVMNEGLMGDLQFLSLLWPLSQRREQGIEMESCRQEVLGLQSGWHQSRDEYQRQVRTVWPLHGIMAGAGEGSGGSAESPRLNLHKSRARGRRQTDKQTPVVY